LAKSPVELSRTRQLSIARRVPAERREAAARALLAEIEQDARLPSAPWEDLKAELVEEFDERMGIKRRLGSTRMG
jgi:hypothetical protein